MIITANEVKTKGVSFFEKIFKKADEIIINVRGKNKYVVLDIDRYNEFRQNELDIAYMKIVQDIEQGKFKIQTASDHVKELMDGL